MTEPPASPSPDDPGANYPPPNYGAGYPPPPPQPYSEYPAQPFAPRNGMGIAALVVGLLSLFGVFCFGFGGFILGLIAIVLGFLGRGKVKRGEANNGGLASAGIALGVLGIIVNIALLAFGVMSFMKIGGTDFVDCMRQAGNDQAAQEECANSFESTLNDRFSVTLTPSP
jgi:hypothetical protein